MGGWQRGTGKGRERVFISSSGSAEIKPGASLTSAQRAHWPPRGDAFLRRLRLGTDEGSRGAQALPGGGARARGASPASRRESKGSFAVRAPVSGLSCRGQPPPGRPIPWAWFAPNG